MRTEREIKKLILDFAKNNDKVRAVILNGSRANPTLEPDKYQDYDIVFIVEQLSSFISDNNWTNFLGEKIIEQQPELMTFGTKSSNDIKISFSYLMLFKDQNRIDLTLFSKENFNTDYKYDSLTIVWLDKDKLFEENDNSNDSDYWVKKPNEKEFLDTCNEFWWVATYVAKGLARNEIIYAKDMLETVVRPMFMKCLEWKIGGDYNYSVTIGKSGKFLKKHLAKSLYNKVLDTYSDSKLESNWKSLVTLLDFFQQISNEIAQRNNFQINVVEQNNTKEYLIRYYEEQKALHQWGGI